jgi:arylsulfatase A
MRPAPLVALLAALLAGCRAGQDAQPNVILFLADDLGAGELGCYGGSECRTPNIDRLASEGLRFEHAWATPICTPTRVELLTGQYAFRTGWFNLIGARLSPQPGTPAYRLGEGFTLADLFRSRGYATALAGKWQLGGDPRECGFDECLIWGSRPELPAGVEHTGGIEYGKPELPARYWHPSLVQDGVYRPTRPEDYGPDLIHEFALDFLRRKRAQPFFLFYSALLPHDPFLPTPDPGRPGERRPRGLVANVEYLDHLTGTLLASLDELGLRENTLVLWLSDNGTHGRGKGKLSEAGVRVPFLARWPGRIEPGVSQALTDASDVLPTLAELTAAEVRAGHALDGRSLVPLLLGRTEAHRPWIFSYLEEGRMLRDERWILAIEASGRERLLDAREGTDRTDSQSEDARQAHARLAPILRGLPGPEAFPGPLAGREDAGR